MSCAMLAGYLANLPYNATLNSSKHHLFEPHYLPSHAQAPLLSAHSRGNHLRRLLLYQFPPSYIHLPLKTSASPFTLPRHLTPRPLRNKIIPNPPLKKPCITIPLPQARVPPQLPACLHEMASHLLQRGAERVACGVRTKAPDLSDEILYVLGDGSGAGGIECAVVDVDIVVTFDGVEVGFAGVTGGWWGSSCRVCWWGWRWSGGMRRCRRRWLWWTLTESLSDRRRLLLRCIRDSRPWLVRERVESRRRRTNRRRYPLHDTTNATWQMLHVRLRETVAVVERWVLSRTVQRGEVLAVDRELVQLHVGGRRLSEACIEWEGLWCSISRRL